MIAAKIEDRRGVARCCGQPWSHHTIVRAGERVTCSCPEESMQQEVRRDPKQRARAVVYAEAARFLDALTFGGEPHPLPSLQHMQQRAGIYCTNVDAMKDALRFVADELWRRSRGRGPYKRRSRNGDSQSLTLIERLKLSDYESLDVLPSVFARARAESHADQR